MSGWDLRSSLSFLDDTREPVMEGTTAGLAGETMLTWWSHYHYLKLTFYKTKIFLENHLKSFKPGYEREPGHGGDGPGEHGPGQPPAPGVEDAEREVRLPDVRGN